MEHEKEQEQVKLYPPVKSITVRVITDKPVKKTPYQVKGVLMRLFPDEEIVPMLDGRYRDRFLYPRVQIKILNEQIYMVGVGEGVAAISAISRKMEILDFGNITFQVLDVDVEESDNHLHPTNRLIRYRFITPWVALNQMTGSRYRFLNNPERVSFLNRLLGQNIVFIAREMGMDLTEKIYTKVSLSTLFPKPVDENAWGAFFGEFRTNFILPNYLGVGNGITRGYGAIYGLFNPDMFSFDESVLKAGAEKEEPEEISEELTAETTEGMDAVEADEVPKPRRETRTGPVPRGRRTVRRRSGFKNFNAPRGAFPEEHSRFSKDVDWEKGDPASEDPADDDAKFNSPEYHRKRHDL
ncbi:MAG: CRISPR-associated endonuclease Cas6 [FCB group bacterium]|nr:CRISPR-associated endonuclease Cas6 [FCB group bacterium]